MMHPSQQGFTLIEVMIGLFVFSVGILAVAGMQVCSLHCTSKASRGTLDAVAVATQLEQILSLPFEDAGLVDTDDGHYPEHPDHGPFRIESTSSSIEWEVDDDFSAKGLKRISITVRWNSGRRQFGSFSYDYVKSDRFY
jgi:type IV pilus assembly protein PilV